MGKQAFEKFINNEPKGAKKKEAFRQEKKRLKAEAKAIGDQRRKEKWEKQRGILPDDTRNAANTGFRKPGAASAPVSRFAKGPEKKFKDAKSTKKEPLKFKHETRKDKVGPGKKAKAAIELKEHQVRKSSEPGAPENANQSLNAGNAIPANRKQKTRFEKRKTKSTKRPSPAIKNDTSVDKLPMAETKEDRVKNPNAAIPLNKFIAHSGVCGRREAAELVKQGLVQVNKKQVNEPGFKVSEADIVSVRGKQVFMQKNPVYILINKPKDYITTSEDPQGRKTVLDIVKNATPERIYPVGRLDRNTTGVLLLTNDGELAQKLTHPSFEVRKVYEVTLDKPLVKKDFEQILQGVTLEDGLVRADVIGYADPKNKNIIGIEIHSGRNRIVRRIFEHLGYDVKNLDRVMFGNLTKKNVERGKWRFLSEKEIRLLKFMNQSFVRKKKSEES